MDSKQSESWITDTYQEFYNKAVELAGKECTEVLIKTKGENTKFHEIERRDRHLDAMVAMFIEAMRAPVPSDNDDIEDCGGEDVGTCDGCSSLPQCQERWRIHKQN